MNQVATKKEGALAKIDYESSANQGFQNMSREDLALPFLKILGQLSPEVNKRDGKYVSGAEPGKIINTVTNELFDSVDVLPCHYKRQFIEWQDRGTSTGAPVAIHEVGSDIVSQTTRGKDYKDRLPNGNYLDNTANYFVIVLGKTPQPALISMKSTQLKVSRKWNSMMQNCRWTKKDGSSYLAPSFGNIYKLSTVQMKNDKGTWYGWDVKIVGKNEDYDSYQMAKSFSDSVGKGEQEVKYSEEPVKKTSSNY
jgi:hypothetical protein